MGVYAPVDILGSIFMVFKNRVRSKPNRILQLRLAAIGKQFSVVKFQRIIRIYYVVDDSSRKRLSCGETMRGEKGAG